MRIAIDRDDVGYKQWLALNDANLVIYVYLDGRPVPYVVLCDDELGEVEYYELNNHGQPKIVNNNLVVVKAKGKVKIHLEHKQ